MKNEGLFLIRLAIEAILIMFAGKMGKAYLYAVMTINLILVPIFGQKIITIYGIETNGGNTFYATAILCFAMIIEKYGRQEFMPAIALVIFSVGSYIALSFLSTYIPAINVDTGNLIAEVFHFTPKIMLASLVAFAATSTFFVLFYDIYKNKFEKYLVFNLITCVVIVQAIDSLIFFFIAFYGTLPMRELLIAMLFGFIMKSIISFGLIPFVMIGLSKSVLIKKFKINL